MKIIYLAIGALTVWSTSTISSLTNAAEFPMPKIEYSADVRMDLGRDPSGKPMVMSGKLYFGIDRERREFNSFGQTNIIIRRQDKGVTWHLIPKDRIYIENPGGFNQEDPEAMIREGKVKFNKLGAEKINGMQTTKYRIEVLNDDGSRFEGYHWAAKGNIPVRLEGVSEGRRFQIDYTNIVKGRQDPGLFEIPRGFQRMATPQWSGGPPSGMGAGGGMPQGTPPAGMSQEQMDQMRKQMEEMMKRMKPQ